MRCIDGPKINHSADLKPLNSAKAEEIKAKSDDAVNKLNILKAYLNDFKTIVQRAPQGLQQKCKTVKQIAKLFAKDGEFR